jgi:hypothetical protein
MPICEHCGLRPAEKKDYINRDLPDYCETCVHAAKLVYTSVDDARQSIKTADIDTIYMAAKFELEKGHTRSVMMKMLRARLCKLTGISTLTFPGEKGL